jgi:hypothetical protein
MYASLQPAVIAKSGSPIIDPILMLPPFLYVRTYAILYNSIEILPESNLVTLFKQIEDVKT